MGNTSPDFWYYLLDNCSDVNWKTQALKNDLKTSLNRRNFLRKRRDPSRHDGYKLDLCPTCLGNGDADVVIPIQAGFGSDCPTCIAEVIQDFLPCAACSGTGSLCRTVWEEFLEWRRQEEIE